MKRLILALIVLWGSAAYGQTAISADGIVESRLGGFAYPDGTIQASAAVKDEVRTPIDSVPITISEAGSYYLTGNLTMTGSGNAITVEADHVTIDLMGFTLDGAGVGERGVYMTDVEDIEIRDGTICNFIHIAIWMQQGVVFKKHGVRVIGVRAYDNTSGIALDGHNHLVKGCVIVHCSYTGIWAQSDSQVINNIVEVTGTGAKGIHAMYGGSVVDNRVLALGGAEAGIIAGTWVKVRGNQIGGGAGACIKVPEFRASIEENLIEGCIHGIEFGQSGNFYANNRVTGTVVAFDLGTTTQMDGGGNWDGTVP